MMPTSMNTSPKIATTPEANSSLSTSTSVVTRVMSRPTGFRSKNRTSSFCSCPYTSMRRSNMMRWPVICRM